MKNLHFIFLVIFLALFVSEEVYGQGGNCNCHPVNDLTITISGSDNGVHDASGLTNVCIEGTGIFSGTIINLSADAVICIDEEVTYEFGSAITDNDDENWGQIWPGTWTVNNYGKFIGSTVLTLQDGQTFNNYSYGDYESYGDVDADLFIEAGFYIRPGGEGREENDQFNIDEGGEFNNYGSINISGDFVNNGEFLSDIDAIINVGNEFHNESGTSDILTLRAYGEITNTGEITLRGVIESVTDGFRNARDDDSGTVIGVGSPCVMIKVATFIENNGDASLLDGENGSIILDSGEENYDRSGNEEPGVYAVGQADDVNITGECFSRLAAVLPVLWDGFSAEYITYDKSIKLDWSTSKEWENNHFEIERSVDGVDKYQEIGRVAAVGWSDLISYYSFKDTEPPINAERLYYRIKQVDLDGGYSYSKTLMVEMPTINYTHGVWKVYPNPTKGEWLKLVLTKKEQYKGELINFRIFNTINATAYQKVTSLAELNYELAETVRNFSSGLVVLELRWGESAEYIKVINR
ncbi:hypothetical protein [Echinicola shivajiensis]|uniref:hypothetical protein n=1 Tax=Echinicola shivajiensis TaxID=1035916 RepID=UPI001BFC561E|nr:hypothetical protein [Echinicola shivajiensis]